MSHPQHAVPTYFETLGERSQELDFDGQANEGSHAAVRNGGGEGHRHCALGVAHLGGGGLSEVLALSAQRSSSYFVAWEQVA